MFRWYLGLSSRWANAGEAGRQLDYQVWCGPAMGAFNEWAKGSFLEAAAEPHGGRGRAEPALRRGRRSCGGKRCGSSGVAPARRVLRRPRPLATGTRLSGDCRTKATELNDRNDSEPTPAGDRRHRLPVPEGGRAGVLLGEHQARRRLHRARCRRRTGARTTTSTPTRRRRTGPTPAAAASSTPVDFNPLEFGIAPARPRGDRHDAAARPGRGEAGADRRRRGVRRQGQRRIEDACAGRPQPRLGHPRRHRHAGTGDPARRAARPPDLEAGAEGRRRRGRADRRRGRAHRRVVRPLAGELLPRPARQRRRRADRQPARPRRHQLRRRCRLRQLARARSTSPALELQPGRADVVVTGGVDTFNDIFMYMCFSKTPALSPTGDAKPFDADGDGTILGEGLGMVVLKRLADAERDGDPIYAVIRGIGTSSDGKGNAIYAPSADGQRRCLRRAYRAGRRVAGHDRAGRGARHRHEGRRRDRGGGADGGVSATARRRGPWCALGSVKSQIGHTKAAAGAAGLIKAALALYHKVLPPTIKVTQPVEPLAAPRFAVLRQHRDAAVAAAGRAPAAGGAVARSASAAATSTRCSRSTGRRSPRWTGTARSKSSRSAPTRREALAVELAKVPTDWNAFARFAEAVARVVRCYRKVSARLRRAPHAHRSAETARGREGEARGRSECHGVAHAGGCALRHRPRAGKLAVLFPGQGSQTSACSATSPACSPRCSIALLPRTKRSPRPRPMLPILDGSPTASTRRPRSTPTRKKRQDAELRETRNAQPALGAVSFGAWQVLNERFGLTGRCLRRAQLRRTRRPRRGRAVRIRTTCSRCRDCAAG